MKRRSGPTRHLPTEDPTDPGWCTTCNLKIENAIHDLPTRSTEERATTARIVGERDA